MELLYLATAVLCIGFVRSDILVYTEFSNQVNKTNQSLRSMNIYKTNVYVVQLIEEFRDLPAKFGRQLPSNGFKVHGITGNPTNGCSPLDPPPNDPDTDGFKWAVLIAR